MIKILKNNIFDNPKFIYKINAFDLKQYDRIYENWHRPNHESWQEFQNKNNLKIIDKFSNKQIYQYNGKCDVVGYLFLKDRNDKRHVDVHFASVKQPYLPNTLLILTKENSISFSKTESALPDKPFLVIEFNVLFLETINKFF